MLEAEGRGREEERRGGLLRRGLKLRTHQLLSPLRGGGGGREACRAAWREVVIGAGRTMQKKRGKGSQDEGRAFGR